MNIVSFWDELRRRHVVRVGVAYVVGAVAVGGGAEVFLSELAPDWVLPTVLWILVLGLPLALALAWAYDFTPEGLVRAPSQAGIRELGDSDAQGEVVTAPTRPSIIVLPFDNMSPDPNDAYFCDGLTEEIITKLSYLRSLRVISRNSAVVLKGTQRSTRSIAAELGVQYVLEGSVRKSGNALRITAQLIEAEDDDHLWADRYDGDLGDVFRIQEEVARSIVSALAVELGSSEERRISARGTEDLRAYECYLRVRHELLSTGEGSLDRSLDLIDRGIAMAGDNDLLYALKAHVLFQVVNTMSTPPAAFEQTLDEAREYAERALVLNPESEVAHAALGAISVNGGDPERAVRHYADALRLGPNNPEALLFLGWTVAAGGWDPGAARRLLRRAGEVDPLTPVMAGAVGWIDWMQGNFDAALRSFEDWSRELEEVRSPWRIVTAYLHAGAGQVEEAVSVVHRMTADAPNHVLTALAQFLSYCWQDQGDKAFRVVSSDLEAAVWWDDLWPMLLADGFARIGDRDRAFHWLEHAVAFGFANAEYIAEHDPFLSGLRSDHRFARVIEQARKLSEKLSGLVDIDTVLPA